MLQKSKIKFTCTSPGRQAEDAVIKVCAALLSLLLQYIKGQHVLPQ